MDKTKTAVSLRVCTAARLALLRELCNDDPGGPRSSVAGGDRHRNLVKLGQGVLRQVGRRGVLLQTSHLLRAGDGNHMLPLRQGPGYGDLRRRGPQSLSDGLHRFYYAAVALHRFPGEAWVAGAEVVLVEALP